MSRSSFSRKEQTTITDEQSRIADGIGAAAEGAGQTDFAPGLDAAFPNEFPEGDRQVRCTEGEIPPFVRGVYYLNGPARFGSGDFRYKNWLDGDGMVCALRFGASGVHFTTRYVRSTKLLAEQGARAPLFRAFGTAFPASRLNRTNNGLESPVNVSVYPLGNRILAYGEQGLPWELDPDTLETRGQFTFGGRLNEASPFAAHPKLDLHADEMFNFGIFFSSHTPKLYVYCFNKERLSYRKGVPLEYSCSVHDFALSKNYVVFYLSPYILNINNILQNGRTVIDSLQWEPDRGSKLLILSRRSGDVVAWIPVGNRYCLHLINAFEEGKNLHVDVLEFPEPIYPQYQTLPSLFTDVAPGVPTRFSIDLQKREVCDQSYVEYSQAPDFPALDPRKAMQRYEDFWMLGISAAGQRGRKFFDELVHANWTRPHAIHIYRTPGMTYLGGEPVFIGDPNSTQGVVICQEFAVRDQQSFFLLFDAFDVKKGPIARIPVGQALHLGFHATFVAKEP